MPSESGEHQSRSPAAQNHHNHNQNGHLAPPPQAEALPCPRCDSSNTKFCYYNNYNLSQPRHFCKSCRRYWTHGGTLRDVPVGGGSRKTTKRSRSSSAAAASSSSSSSSSGFVFPHLPLVTKPEPVHDGSASDDPANPNPSGNERPSSNGIGFTSLLNSQTPGGFLALGGQGYGYGYGYGLDELSGFGYGAKPAWPFHEVAEFGGGAGHNTWQIATGSEVGLVDGSSVDCFVWPDLSISMPGGNGLK